MVSIDPIAAYGALLSTLGFVIKQIEQRRTGQVPQDAIYDVQARLHMLEGMRTRIELLSAQTAHDQQSVHVLTGRVDTVQEDVNAIRHQVEGLFAVFVPLLSTMVDSVNKQDLSQSMITEREILGLAEEQKRNRVLQQRMLSPPRSAAEVTQPQPERLQREAALFDVGRRIRGWAFEKFASHLDWVRVIDPRVFVALCQNDDVYVVAAEFQEQVYIGGGVDQDKTRLFVFRCAHRPQTMPIPDVLAEAVGEFHVYDSSFVILAAQTLPHLVMSIKREFRYRAYSEKV